MEFETIDEIVAQLRIWDNAYFNDKPLVSDSEYDALKRLLQNLDPANSYLLEVGAPVKEEVSRKVKLPYQMGSLNQIPQGEIKNWVDKYILDDRFLILTDKLDGVSCLLIYKDGKLSQAFSRGDGYEGQDITKHVSLVPSVPKTLEDDTVVLLAVRAELIMRKQAFQQNFASEFKNPRNMVAGVFNRKEPVERYLSHIDLVAYEIVDHKILNTDLHKHKQANLSTLKEWGFSTVSFVGKTGGELSDAYLKKYIEGIRATSPYELDGIVITVDDWGSLELQSSAQTLNPEHSVKYKILDESTIQETEVIKVHYEISKSGYQKPRVEIRPVNIGGVTITYATGFHGKFINDNGIGPGAKVRITRSGDVIPYILEVTKKATAQLPEGDWSWNETGVDIVVNKDNPEVIFKQVLDFFTSLDVELLKEASLKELFEKFDFKGEKYTQILLTMFDLTETEYEKVIGANGKKIYASLHRRLQNLSMPVLMGSLNYCGVGFGVRKAKALLEQVSFEELQKMSVEEVAELNGFDVKTATAIVRGVPAVAEFMLAAEDFIAFKTEEKVSAALENINVVMTGFRDKDLHAKIEAMGGKVSSGVSGKTTHLLQMDVNSASSKTKKAKELGITIMTPDQFKDAFNL
jgi:NAD-dependent DNA ligase